MSGPRSPQRLVLCLVLCPQNAAMASSRFPPSSKLVIALPAPRYVSTTPNTTITNTVLYHHHHHHFGFFVRVTVHVYLLCAVNGLAGLPVPLPGSAYQLQRGPQARARCGASKKKKKKHREGEGGRETDRHTDTLTERKRGGRGCSCCVNFWGLALVCSPWQVTMCTKKHSDLACLGSAERPNTPSPARPTCPCFVC